MDRRSALAILLGAAAVGPFVAKAARAEEAPGAMPPEKPGTVETAPGVAPAAAEPTGTGIEVLQKARAYRDKVAAIGLFATEASRVIADRGRNLEIRAFAQLEIDEQAALSGCLLSAGPQPVLATDEVAFIERMKGMRMSSSLDRFYLTRIMDLHADLLAVHKAYVDEVQDPVARAVAMVAVPSITTHLAMLGRLKRNKYV